MRRMFGGLVAVGVALALTGCGDDPEENTAQACAAQQDLAAAIEDFDAVLSPSASVDEIRQARDDVAQAATDLDDAAGDVAQDRADALESAWDELDEAVEDVDGDDTVPEAVDSLRDEAAQVTEAREALVAELGC